MGERRPVVATAREGEGGEGDERSGGELSSGEEQRVAQCQGRGTAVCEAGREQRLHELRHRRGSGVEAAACGGEERSDGG